MTERTTRVVTNTMPFHPVSSCVPYLITYIRSLMRTLFSRQIASLGVPHRASEQLAKPVCGRTSSVTVQRTAQGRVTSDYPTIELCARARSFTGGRCKSEMLQLSLLHLPRCNCPLVHTLVTLASLRVVHAPSVRRRAHGTSEYY